MCEVLSCNNEAENNEFCGVCIEVLKDQKNHTLVVCWECQTILDIYIRKDDDADTLFTMGCRRCQEIGSERKKFRILGG